MWFSNAASTSVASTIVCREHFDVSLEANHSLSTKFLCCANVGPEEKVALTFCNEIGGCACPGFQSFPAGSVPLGGFIQLGAAVVSLISPPSGSFGHCFRDFG